MGAGKYALVLAILPVEASDCGLSSPQHGSYEEELWYFSHCRPLNVFINETNWFPETTDFDTSDIPSLLTKIDSIQQNRLTAIFANYTMNEQEVRLFPYYKRLTELFQYPNVCSMISWLKDPSRQAKAIALIESLLEKPISYME